MKRKQFYNLDGFRFFAALFVVLGHIEIIKAKFNLPSFYNNNFIKNVGTIAVTFFFVLSGFLIAYLLMLEQQHRESSGKKINLARFYKNRILRIWPLYYSLIFLVYLVLLHIPFFSYEGYNQDFLIRENKGLLVYMSFCPNLSELLYGNVLYLGQTWSLAVEEFFYFFFPLGLFFLSSKNNLEYFVVLIFFSIAITATSKFWCDANDINLPLMCIYISRYKIYAFALGALAAYGYLHLNKNDSILKYEKQTKMISYTLFLITVGLLFTGITFSSLTHPVYAFIFAILIFLTSISNIKIKLLNHSYIIYLGKISYGIYMLHPLAIVISIKMFYYIIKYNAVNAFIFDIITIGIVIILSIISYTFLEKPFLKMKR